MRANLPADFFNEIDPKRAFPGHLGPRNATS